MIKSELIEILSEKNLNLSTKDVELAVKSLLDLMTQTLANGERIEVRGFGSFSLHFHKSRNGRNPKTGETVKLSSKYTPHFKPGRLLRERVNRSRLSSI